MAGVIAVHRDRMQNEKGYREAALTIDDDSPATCGGKFLESHAPLALKAAQVDESDAKPKQKRRKRR